MKVRHPTVAACALAVATAARAEQASLRCGGKLVLLGAPVEEVVAKCGPPASERHGSEWVRRRLPADDELETPVFLEHWTYDPGPSDFVRYVTFRNGRLEDIELGGYGTPR